MREAEGGDSFNLSVLFAFNHQAKAVSFPFIKPPCNVENVATQPCFPICRIKVPTPVSKSIKTLKQTVEIHFHKFVLNVWYNCAQH